eukprot:3391765-Prymnesium_polylepis.1
MDTRARIRELPVTVRTAKVHKRRNIAVSRRGISHKIADIAHRRDRMHDEGTDSWSEQHNVASGARIAARRRHGVCGAHRSEMRWCAECIAPRSAPSMASDAELERYFASGSVAKPALCLLRLRHRMRRHSRSMH